MGQQKRNKQKRIKKAGKKKENRNGKTKRKGKKRGRGGRGEKTRKCFSNATLSDKTRGEEVEWNCHEVTMCYITQSGQALDPTPSYHLSACQQPVLQYCLAKTVLCQCLTKLFASQHSCTKQTNAWGCLFIWANFWPPHFPPVQLLSRQQVQQDIFENSEM